MGTLAPAVPSGTTYDVTVAGAPIGQTCAVAGGMGMVTTAAADVAITCGDAVSVKVVAPAGDFVNLSLNAGPTQQVVANGASGVVFTFQGQPVMANSAFTVTGNVDSTTCMSNGHGDGRSGHAARHDVSVVAALAATSERTPSACRG